MDASSLDCVAVNDLWTSGCLVIYLVMGQTPLFGATAPEFDFLAFARVIFASAQGSLVELGIGPIVTGGLLMQKVQLMMS